MCARVCVCVVSAGRIVGETKYLGFYERETDWDQNHITRIKVSGDN